MGRMFLRTRLHMYLLWSTCVFGLLAFLSYLVTDSSSSSSVTTVVGGTTTSTTISPANTAAPLKYTVLPGESLFGIAAKMKVSAPALVALNKIKNPDRLDVGTVLLLPPATGFVPIGATTTMQP
ncbi:MAG: LysM peptidoglycan-binding domain-containing protein [Actinobacteria bacterium]|uniref:Unannotated protein n=1 Tax=freshwater metagenome TaxID=449393 RepID=A0A6J6VBA1_9ZZZZ|nr:LysM peptidoglycan-binding domain-containing protein [Actinomycetota bacterium]MTB12467.1 LysM peptidoglycan-binding domain-containing protein [Actinomycetota bacterium]